MRIAFILSIKTRIDETTLREKYTSVGVGHQNVSQEVSLIADENTKYFLINLISIIYNRKIDILEELPELLKLHCRHGFDILESKLEGIEINNSILDFFLNEI
jgi:hypothetical protein